MTDGQGGMQADLKPLEFPAILRLLERFSSTPYGADAIRNLEPAPTPGAARALQRAITAARERIESGTAPVLEGIFEIRPALRQARNQGAALSVQALHNIQLTLRVAGQLAEQLADTPEMLPGGIRDWRPPDSLIEVINTVLTPGGSLREDASPQLRELHAERGRLRRDAERVVREKATDIEHEVGGQRVQQWHQERAVLVLPASVADKVRGVRRGSVFGGRDSIVEPIEAVALNNQLDAVNERINAEQQRLLRAMTDAVRSDVEALESVISALTWIDLALAGGRLSQKMNAHAPVLAEAPGVKLVEAYHPLLWLQFAEGHGPCPVPLSLELRAGQSLMLVTGPNTGGKTVALKTLGLLVTMAWCGLHIPAEGDCEIGYFDRVLVDIGDQQSLMHHLSTFAGHVEVLKRVLEVASPRSLILLDELGTGTDPDEGAALAMAVLDELRARGAFGVVNTHLAPLKRYVEQAEGILNASMQFDPQRLVPTYRLLLGESGVSFGLVIAEANGLPAGLVARAREHLAQGLPAPEASVEEPRD